MRPNSPISRKLWQALAVRRWGVWLLLGLLSGCQQPYSEERFQKEIEKAYVAADPGWGVYRRKGRLSSFVRGDQLDTVDTEALYKAYQASKQSGSDFVAAWQAEQAAAAKARHQSLETAKDRLILTFKSKNWVTAQDLGAIGPKSDRAKLRPWRKEIASGFYAVIGVPEAKRGYRYASMAEMAADPGEEAWMAAAIANAKRRVQNAEPDALRDKNQKLLVLDFPNEDGVGALILDPAFRRDMLGRFEASAIGAAVPLREVLILFPSEDPLTQRPIRARTHQLFDTQNHAGFRGLLRLEQDSLSILEAPYPEPAKGR